MAREKPPLRRERGANGEAGPKGTGQEPRSEREATPLGACRAAPTKSVSRGRAFRQHIGQLRLRCPTRASGNCACVAPLGHRATAPALPPLGHPCPCHALAMPLPCPRHALALSTACGPVVSDAPAHSGGKSTSNGKSRGPRVEDAVMQYGAATPICAPGYRRVV